MFWVQGLDAKTNILRDLHQTACALRLVFSEIPSSPGRQVVIKWFGAFKAGQCGTGAAGWTDLTCGGRNRDSEWGDPWICHVQVFTSLTFQIEVRLATASCTGTPYGATNETGTRTPLPGFPRHSLALWPTGLSSTTVDSRISKCTLTIDVLTSTCCPGFASPEGGTTETGTWAAPWSRIQPPSLAPAFDRHFAAQPSFSRVQHCSAQSHKTIILFTTSPSPRSPSFLSSRFSSIGTVFFNVSDTNWRAFHPRLLRRSRPVHGPILTMERVLRIGRMEGVARVGSRDLGHMAMLQTGTHAGKAVPSLQKSRTWKGPSSKGLGEIEEIGKEEVSNKMIQALERFMMAHPAVWSESSVQHLLVVESSPQLVGFLFHEVADTRYASEAQEHLQTIINRILVPMAKIMEAEQEVMMADRQKNHQATLALERAREECHHALEGMKQEHDRSAKDLEELQKALDENKVAAEEAGRKLAAKEKEIQDVLEKQRNLVIRLVCGGPTAFIEWAREELQAHGLADQLDSELGHAWRLTMTVPDPVEDKMLIPDECSSYSHANASLHEGSSIRSNQSIGNYEDSAKPAVPTSWTQLSVKLLCLVVSEVGRQVEESYDRVKSPLSLPSVIAGFWIGLARRFTYLAVSSLLPQLAELPPQEQLL